jgi:hypothetical protein
MRGTWLLLFTSVVANTACGSDSPPSTPGANSCAGKYDCRAGQSCGTTDGTTFLCSKSGSGNEGDACNAAQALPLQCADHLLCLGDNGVGTCRRWCSESDPCPSGSCATVSTTRGAEISFCLPATTPAAGSCGADYNCPAGQSCGTTDGQTLFCSASGPDKEGDACDANQGLPFQCGDHLLCLGVNDVGSCRRWCSAGDPCSSGSCTMVTTTHGLAIQVCM